MGRLVFEKSAPNKNVWVALCIEEYFKRTKTRKSTKAIVITYVTPQPNWFQSSISGKRRLSLKDIQKSVGLSQSTNFENYHSKIIMVPPYYRVIQ